MSNEPMDPKVKRRLFCLIFCSAFFGPYAGFLVLSMITAIRVWECLS